MLPRDRDTLRDLAENLGALSRRVRQLEGLEYLFGEAAAMLLCCGGPPPASQSIPSGVWTDVDFNFASGGTWEMGLALEDGHLPGGDGVDKVYAEVVQPGQAIMFFTMEVYWAVAAGGTRALRWGASDGSFAAFYGPVTAGGVCAYSAVHWRRQVAATAYYFAQVYQDSGAPIDLEFFNFGIWRLR